MMSKKSPQLRFEGFTDDWEERKLENIAQINKGIQRGKQEISSVRNELNPYPVYNGGKKASGYTDECNRENSVMVSEGGASAGYVNYYSGKYWSGGHNFTISNDTKHDTFFLLYVLQKSQEKLYKLQVGTGLPNIQLKSIKDFPIYSTSNTEQQKIGSFFKQLDNTIALHQRKLDLLKEQKKGYLQKMFPKNGAKVPELRFEGFADDWEERKLGDLANIVRGASPRPIQDSKWFDKDSDIGWLRISDVTDQNGRIHHLEQRISKLGQEKTRVLKEPHLLLSIAATVGKPLVNYVKTGVHDGFLIFLNPSFEREFMFQWLEMFRPNWKKYGQPGSQVNLNSELVRNQEIPLPSIEEQQKIGSFFKQLDDTIALHQCKLDLLKEQKKGFLQKMFV
ncbi:restriction endonuclease subunit S [Lactococcus petauri]|uniref:restriction endonuclease subunit S n=1 Tax=Lactococcus petauri TaxID=1940789 RepID=UPI0022E546E8|nr:restriction endonuclease subunit S [Lactococcus petauri]